MLADNNRISAQSRNMNDDQMQRLRERLTREELEEHEQRLILREEVVTIAQRDTAITIAARVATIGTVPSIAWLVKSALSQGWTGVLQLVFGLLCFLVPFIVIAGIAGIICGLLAHWWFSRSTISVPWAAVIMALLVDAVLFGWVMVLTR